MPKPISDAEIIAAATVLVETNGFARAKAKADEMIESWRCSTVADANEGQDMWERIRAAIVVMEALVV